MPSKNKAADSQENIGFAQSLTKNTIVMTIALAITASLLYDVIAKPGLGYLGNWLFRILTFGSEQLNDLAYESAALNPNSIPMMIVLFAALFAPSLVACLMYGFVSGMNASKRNKVTDNKKSERQNRIAKILFFGILGVYGFIVSATVTHLVKSVNIWRIFNANVAICKPYINTQEEDQIRAKFASMRSKREYIEISKHLMDIAESNKIELRAEKIE